MSLDNLRRKYYVPPKPSLNICKYLRCKIHYLIPTPTFVVEIAIKSPLQKETDFLFLWNNLTWFLRLLK